MSVPDRPPRRRRPGLLRLPDVLRRQGVLRRPWVLRRPGAAAPLPDREPVRLSELEEREVHLVLDFSLRAGEVLLSGGAGAADVTATIMSATTALGLRRVEVDVTFTSITVSYVRAPDVAPVTAMRVVRHRALDYTRLAEVDNLVTDLLEERVDRDGAFTRMERLRRARHPYRRWQTTVAYATLSAAVTVLLGGGSLGGVTAFASTLVVAVVILALARRSVPQFYTNALGAAIATSAAVLMAALDAPLSPSLVVAGGIILLLPGVTLVGAVQDAITGYYVTASARAVETFLLTAGIITGVAVVLWASVRLGVDIRLSARPVPRFGEGLVQTVAAGVASAAFAFANYAPRRTVPAAALAGALGWAAFLALQLYDVPPTFATAIAAVFVGLGGFALAGRQHAPALIYVAAGTLPLLPGLTIYQGMLLISQDQALSGILTLSQALTVGLALAAGVVLGDVLAHPVRREVRRFERRIVGPRLAGPRWRGAGERAGDPAPGVGADGRDAP